MEADVRRLKEIETALKRMNVQIKNLRVKKKEAEEKLYKSMVKNGTEVYQGYSIKKIQPKIPRKSKPLKKKKIDGVEFFQAIGVEDPEEAYEEFIKTQKNLKDNEDAENI